MRSAMLVPLSLSLLLSWDRQSHAGDPGNRIPIPIRVPSPDPLTILQLANRITEVQGGTKVSLPPPSETRTSIVVSMTLPRINAEDYTTNRVFGWEVPGRRMSAKVWVTCELHVAFDLDTIQIERDTDFPDTIIIKLPEPKVTADFVEGVDADYEVEYGKLKNKWLSQNDARALRETMYAKAKQDAQDKYPHFRKEVVGKLQDFFRKQYPSVRLYVR